MSIKKGDKVRIEYVGWLEDGTVFDRADDPDEPFIFTFGTGEVIPAFEESLKDMKAGEEKDIVLEPEDAYGDPDPNLIRSVPRSQFPPEPGVEEGSMVLLTLPEGEEIPAVVCGMDEESIVLDLNHPLSGMKLRFKLTLKEIISSKKD
ncbi:MAG: peptidylprolyl isomerase [Candidatus Thermoplasmatota archaeon]|nr:peptidylprolyl isomerase [Candidatus Thermoplasmatota archaeon]